jgi:8-amino-7-oxononanoate synthase
VLATAAVRDHLVNTARPFIYDTGLAPGAAGAATAALRLLLEEPHRVDRVHHVARMLAKAGRVDEPDGAVLAIAMPGPREAVAAVARAAEQGVRIGCFRPPSTPDGISRLRLTAHAHLTDADVESASGVLEGIVG